MKHANGIKWIAVILSFALLATTLTACESKKTEQEEEGTTAAAERTEYVQQIFTDKPGSITKSETVFVNLNASGQPKSIVVSDWLHTDKAGVRVEDISDSEQIINVKGLEMPEIDGENIVWNMSSTDLYYRGFSNKTLPVEVDLSYTLNGEQVSPESLSGKSGALGIDISVTNNISKQVNVDGKELTIYCPFMLVGGMIFSDPNYTNVNVQGGRVIADGAHQAVLFVSIPGMRESIGLDELNIGDIEGFSFPDRFSLSADVTNCSVGNMYFAVLPLSALGFGGFAQDDLAGLENALGEMTSLVNAMYDINADKILSILTGNSDNVTSLLSAVSEASELYKKNEALLAALSKYLTTDNMTALGNFIRDMESVDMAALANALSDPSVQKLLSDVGNIDFGKYSDLLNNPLLKSLFSDMATVLSDMSTAMPALDAFTSSVSDGEIESLLSDINALMPMIRGLSEDVKDPDVQKSLEALPETVNSLNQIVAELKTNKELVDALSEFATADNINKLSSVLDSTKQSDLSALLSLIGVSADMIEIIVPRLDQVLKFSSSYTIYSKAPEGMNTAVMFVYQTAGI